MSTLQLDLADIQGNILRGYRTLVARYLFVHFENVPSAARFVRAVTEEITTAVEWDVKPDSTVNIALTARGLAALGVAADTLELFPPEFRQGMRARARQLGDLNTSDPSRWEAMWQTDDVHAFVMVGGREAAPVEARVRRLRALCAQGGVTILGEQNAGALVIDGKPSNREHFGYADGFGNPDIGATGFAPRPGGGKPVKDGGWKPVAPGEFLLGHPNEAGEITPTPPPLSLFRNGTFAVYRKLHQNVGSFRKWLADEGARFPDGPEMLAAKVIGRWRDGTPLALSPDRPDPAIVADRNRVINFRYADDPEGLRCPLGSHVRRVNPRDGLGFGTKLTAGRRIVRRGIPYGSWTPEDQPADDAGEHGFIFLAFNASCAEQFEFVQQQWINYGNDQHQGNDTDPLLGDRGGTRKFVIPGSGLPGERRPHVCFDLPDFVVTRGGEYFFVPSVTALRWLVQSSDAPSDEILAFDAMGAGDDTQPVVEREEDEPGVLETIVEKVGDVFETAGEIVGAEVKHIGEDIHEAADKLKAWATANPERIFAVLRVVAPIITIKDTTIVTRFEDVQEVLSRDTVFQVPYADGFKTLTGGRNFFLGMSNTAEYQRDASNMRIVVRRDDLDRIATIVSESANIAVGHAPGRVDVVTLATDVALSFVTKYFGISFDSSVNVAQGSAAISGYLFLAADDLRPPAQAASSRILDSLRATVADRKAHRGRRDDVLERCLVLQDANVPGMDDETLLVNLFGLVVGAIPTTVAMATRAIDELLNHPTELGLVHRAAADGDTPTVTKYVSEAMRLSPLGPGVPRVALEDYTIAKGTMRATTVKAGAKVLAALQSATFDGNIIDDPNEFRIDRPDYNYMHFGYGLHTCFGRYINMVQIPRIAQSLLARPNLRRADGDDGTMRMQGPFPSQLIVEFDH